MKRLLGIGMLLVMIAGIAACGNQNQKEMPYPCKGPFYMKMEGYVEKELCASKIDKYSLENNELSLVVTSDELAGKVLFEMELSAYNGFDTYEFGSSKANKCKLVVKGASDEFYHCTSGSIDIISASSDHLEASFEIEIEGFYNKKTIHARGGVRL
jgi:hypothetical protein